MKWDHLIQLFDKHDLQPKEILEMIYAYVHENENDYKLKQELLEMLGDENDI